MVDGHIIALMDLMIEDEITAHHFTKLKQCCSVSGVVTGITNNTITLHCGVSVDLSKSWVMTLISTPNPRTLCQIIGPDIGEIRLLTLQQIAEISARDGWQAYEVRG